MSESKNVVRLDPPEAQYLTRRPEFRGGPEAVSSINWSDPVVWAAKLAYEKFVAEFGIASARMIAAYQKIETDLVANPERGTLARKLASTKRFFRGIWRVLTRQLPLFRTYRGEWRELLAHAWRSRRYIERFSGECDWDTARDALLAEQGAVDAVLRERGVSMEQLIQHKARLDMSVATAPQKREVDYGARMVGFEAGRNKKTAQDNPHPAGSVQHYSWEKGRKQGLPLGYK